MSSRPKSIFCFDMPRCRSHLFFRFLGTHPDTTSLWHPFLPAYFFGPERITTHIAEQTAVDKGLVVWPESGGPSTYAGVISQFVDNVREAESRGSIPLVNEHTTYALKQELTLAWLDDKNLEPLMQTNPTVIPDHIFESLVPVFVIRRPVYSAPSLYHGAITGENAPSDLGGKVWRLNTSCYLQRRFFDYYKDRDGKPPIVVDGDDIVWRTAEVREKLCQGLNLDPEGLSEVWNPRTDDERHPVALIRFFLQVIDDSSGIERPSEYPPDPDLEKNYAKWVDKFGEDSAKKLRANVEENTPHYEYMAQFKV